MSFKSSTLLLLSAAGLASADLSDPNQFVYLNESPADLLAAGFTDTTNGTPLFVEPAECLNCYTFDTLNTTALKALCGSDDHRWTRVSERRGFCCD